jgi:hypothetical protein
LSEGFWLVLVERRELSAVTTSISTTNILWLMASFKNWEFRAQFSLSNTKTASKIDRALGCWQHSTTVRRLSSGYQWCGSFNLLLATLSESLMVQWFCFVLILHSGRRVLRNHNTYRDIWIYCSCSHSRTSLFGLRLTWPGITRAQRVLRLRILSVNLLHMHNLLLTRGHVDGHLLAALCAVILFVGGWTCPNVLLNNCWPNL